MTEYPILRVSNSKKRAYRRALGLKFGTPLTVRRGVPKEITVGIWDDRGGEEFEIQIVGSSHPSTDLTRGNRDFYEVGWQPDAFAILVRQFPAGTRWVHTANDTYYNESLPERHTLYLAPGVQPREISLHTKESIYRFLVGPCYIGRHYAPDEHGNVWDSERRMSTAIETTRLHWGLKRN